MQSSLSVYPDRLRAHLAEYKRTAMCVSEDGTWSRNGRSYAHILPVAQRDLNFISASRTDILGYLAERPHIRLHRDFHHLNSSQAMCINLMYPLQFSHAACGAVGDQLGLPAALDPSTAEFELVPNPSEGTNFDYFIRTVDGASVYFEFKLSEQEFGKASADDRHLNKLKDIYARQLAGMVHESHLHPEHFFPRYQLFRNLSYLGQPNSILVLVIPKAHVKLASQAKAFIANLTESASSRVRLVYMKDLADAMLAASDADSQLQTHMREFQAKYVIA